MQEDEVNIEDDKQASAKYVLGFALLVIAVLIIATLLFISRSTTQDFTLQAETPRQTYLEILGEPHTGLRLVRIDDFIENTAPNVSTPGAKAAREALAANEQIAWAKLTHALYDLKNTDIQKTQALTTYKTTWGIWSRQEGLPKLLQTTLPTLLSSADARYAPNSTHSKFRQGNHKTRQETMLAGAVPTGIIQPPSNIIPSSPVVLNIQKPRIKYAKRPRYPRRARRKGVEAVVTLSLDIDERGNVARTKVISIHADRYKDKFVRAARRAAMASKFHPKTINGRPVASSDYLRQYTFDTES